MNRFLMAMLFVSACTTTAGAQSQVVFFTANDSGYFTPFDGNNAETVKYSDSGWLGGPGSPPAKLTRITLDLATFDAPRQGSVDLELTINDGDPSGLVFGSGTELYRTTIKGVILPATGSLKASYFSLSVDLPSVMLAGNFNDVGWSVSLHNYDFSGQFGFQVGTCNAQLLGFYTNNASHFDGASWSLFSFGANPCTQIAQYAVSIEALVPTALPGDVNGDGVVDGIDIALVLGSWGPCLGCAGDLNDDGVVDGADLAIVLGNWS